MKRALAFVFLLAAATASQALPVEIAVEYRISSLGATIGRVKEQFLRSGETYSINSVTRSEGVLKLVIDDSITLKSHGRIGAGGLQPLEFEQKRAGSPAKDIHATFDWERGVLVSRFAGETREVALPKATQDRISVMYQFMTLTKSDLVEMNMSNGRKVERYT